MKKVVEMSNEDFDKLMNSTNEKKVVEMSNEDFDKLMNSTNEKKSKGSLTSY